MGAVIARRLVLLVPTMLLVSFLVFGLLALVPGDAALQLAGGPDQATPERVAAIRQQLGLDDPFLAQYWNWLKDAARGDLGTSLISGRSVTDELADRLPVTFSIVLAAVVVGVLIAVPVGIVAGMRAGSRLDRGLMFGTIFGIAIPNFFLALMLILAFAVKLRWLPALGFTRITDNPLDWLRSVTLPALAIGVAVAASLARQIRAALSHTLNSNYIRVAWAKGGRTVSVVGSHALKNAAIPAVTVLGLQLGALLGGTVLVENIFAIPGMGTYVLQAMFSRDLPVIQGVALMFAVINVGLALLVDISYSLLNPKVRVS